MFDERQLSRRTVLKATGGSVVGAGATGLATARPDDVVELNVGFDGERGRAAALDAASDVVREFPFGAATIRVPKAAATALADRSEVRYVEANGTVRALAESASWGYDRIDADVANADGYTGDGADVAILDTGIACDHDCLPNVGAGEAVRTCGTNCCAPWDDDNGHGTNVAGIIGASQQCDCTTGVAPDATLHAVKVLDSSGVGSFSDIAAGIQRTADNGWDVCNLSLGASSGSATIEAACEYAWTRGVLLVGAAGASGPCTSCVGYPAAYDEVVAVGATDESDTLASFSSTGPEIEVVAPGTNLPTTDLGDDCVVLSGTSMATAHASGVGALLMAQGYDNVDARDRLGNTAEDVGLASDEQGEGLVDAAAATGA